MGEGASSDITGLIGQYAHGNEPSHHVAYLYAYAGEQWKTAEKVRFIMSDFYTDQPDGIIGNEDCGQMSAWYLLSSMGLYQVNPSDGVFVFGSPCFKKVEVKVRGGNTFTVEAPITATRIPMSKGASGPLGTPLPSSVNAIINPINMDVMTTSTNAACHTLIAAAG